MFRPGFQTPSCLLPSPIFKHGHSWIMFPRPLTTCLSGDMSRDLSCSSFWPGGDHGGKQTWQRDWDGRAKFITISIRSMINREISLLRPVAVSKFQETLVITIATDFTCIMRNHNSISFSWKQSKLKLPTIRVFPISSNDAGAAPNLRAFL